MALDRSLVACLMRINGLEEFEPFRKHLSTLREDCRDKLEGLREQESIYRMQGRASMLKEILDLLAQSPELAKKV